MQIERDVTEGEPGGSGRQDLVFLLDVDNTLFDNDRLKADIGARVTDLLGPDLASRFWELYEEVRQKEQYVDYPATARKLAAVCEDASLEGRLIELLEGMPFPEYLYPRALDTVRHLRTFGTAVILSDGDHVFQPLKIRESGLEAAVDGNVMIAVHKEQELPAVFSRYPARHYAVVDDKPSILEALETCCPTEFTTVFVVQGHYARDSGPMTPAPDHRVDRIGELLTFTRETFLH